MHQRLSISTLAALALLGAAGLWAMRSAPGQPSSIAVVDLEKVYAAVDQHKAAEKDLENTAKGMAARTEELKQEVKAVESELESFKPDTEAFVEAQRKMEEAVGKLRAWQQFCEGKLAREESYLLKQTYDQVKQACALVAADNKIDLVLLDDATPPFPDADPRPMMQQISARRSLYVAPSLDVTQLVIERMNRDFKARQGS